MGMTLEDFASGAQIIEASYDGERVKIKYKVHVDGDEENSTVCPLTSDEAPHADFVDALDACRPAAIRALGDDAPDIVSFARSCRPAGFRMKAHKGMTLVQFDFVARYPTALEVKVRTPWAIYSHCDHDETLSDLDRSIIKNAVGEAKDFIGGKRAQARLDFEGGE